MLVDEFSEGLGKAHGVFVVHDDLLVCNDDPGPIVLGVLRPIVAITSPRGPLETLLTAEILERRARAPRRVLMRLDPSRVGIDWPIEVSDSRRLPEFCAFYDEATEPLVRFDVMQLAPSS